MNRTRVLSVSLVAAFVMVEDAGAQSAPQGATQRIAASSRAAAALCASANATSTCRLVDTASLTVLIEYGQPHARGREVWGTLVPFDSVWRLGANAATHLVTRVPLTIGTTSIPAGRYTLHMRPTAAGGALIVSDSTAPGMWGVPYPGAARDRARIALRMRNLQENVESLQISLVPSATNTSTGTLNIVWGRREYSVDWSAQLASRGRSGAPR
jgi:hypothetical protein